MAFGRSSFHRRLTGHGLSSSTLRCGVLCLLLACAAPVQTAPAQTLPATQPAAVPAATQPGEIRRGMSMAEPAETRYRRWYDNLARQIEPSLRGDPARLDMYLRFFEREIVRDRRLFAFDVQLSANASGQIVMSGVAEYAEHKASLAQLLQTLGFETIDRIQLAPTASADTPPLGVCSSDTGFLRARADGASEVVNQALRGEPVFILHQDGDFLLIHSIDGYVGWIGQDHVQRADVDAFDAAINRATPPQDRIDRVISQAKTHLGRPYVWGGRSDEGLDCSGLVQRSFAAAGLHLPRDAEQQALCGRMVATRSHRSALRPGDILFFLGRRGFVAHTAIYLGEGQYIESADGGVKISRFEDAENTRSRRRDDSFCFAKRVLE